MLRLGKKQWKGVHVEPNIPGFYLFAWGVFCFFIGMVIGAEEEKASHRRRD